MSEPVAGHTAWLEHGKIRLALHALRTGRTGQPVLLLLGLGERAPEALPDEFAGWPGPVHALDFTGHGASGLPRGGGYTAEILMGDVDAALAQLGPTTVCGRGLGAYVALMIAGGRPEAVLGAVLCDGPGLAGGGAHPSSPHVLHPDPSAPASSPDSFALAELSTDIRPPDYAMSYVRQIDHLGRIERPIAVCAVQRPAWLEAVAQDPETETKTLGDALTAFATPRWRDVDRS